MYQDNKKNKDRKKHLSIRFLLVTSLLFSLIFLTSCGRSTTASPGLQMRVLNAPRVLYYTGNNDVYPLQVELKTTGESAAGGALFIYGYSPSVIDVEGVYIPQFTQSDISFSIQVGENPAAVLHIDDLVFQSLNCFNRRVSCLFFFDDVDVMALLDNAIQLVGGGNLRLNINNWSISLPFSFRSGQDYAIGLGPLYYEHSSHTWYFGNVPISGISKEDFFEYLAYGNFFVPVMSLMMPFKAFNGFFFYLRGKNQYNPAGDRYIKTFELRIKGIPAQTEELRQTIGIRACYLYTTDVFIDECIDPTYYNREEANSKPCRFLETPRPKNTNSPVKVTRVEQHISGDKLYITFYIQKVGTGILWNPIALVKCSPYYPFSTNIDPNEKNVVYIGSVFMSTDPTPLECRPSRLVKLDEYGRGVVTCVYRLKYGPTTIYSDQLFMELWYGYQQDVAVPIVIRNIP